MDPTPLAKRCRFIFISSNGSWGGSEELWSATAASLAETGHEITVFKGGIDNEQPRLRRLRELGCRMYDLEWWPFFLRKAYPFMKRIAHGFAYACQIVRLRIGLAFTSAADLVILSQGGNSDGVYFGNVIRKRQQPYVVIVQKASDLYWPSDPQLDSMRAIYGEARACFFVSEHNRQLTEEQIGMALPHATIVRNPALVPWERRSDWPDDGQGLRLACVGRMQTMEKGQDLLLRVLASDKWRKRPLSVTFYGAGPNRIGLEEMAQYLELTSVTFAGFVHDVAAIWNDHHALILPTRCEGLPLVLVEAMLSGRLPIVTTAGGNAEVVDDDVTGFLANAATEDALDEAMERAWSRRDEWQTIGEAAATKIRTLVPPDPAGAMAAMLLRLGMRTGASALECADDGAEPAHHRRV
ncbi:MAG: glycosyltransferase family 4 protein [Acidobacteriota bacterium]|nr:glycosyltransferase family 4 protein [Acidobacteriota bacterium]